ncbi:hypothetical protein BDM02DRAFT_613864 [Thelephora ganbajun]|uniref:Uncharacterized protein n=1 Tax=Thelephora ganbajun TaxID=370292 RepID=A0ACB6Z6B7_THEGA|nr:hypothetical protein BDM02DRAFT_613864 [Thelephora ganbajun]
MRGNTTKISTHLSSSLVYSQHYRRIHADPDPRSGRVALPRRRPRRYHLDRTSSQHRHRSISALRKPRGFTVRCFPRDAREVVGQPIPPESRGFRCRQEPGQAAETGWPEGVALLPGHRKPSGDAPTGPAVARVRPIAIPVDNQPDRRRGYPRLHAFRRHLIHLLHSRSDALLQLSLPDTFHSLPNHHQILNTQPFYVRSFAAISYHTLPFRRKPRMES